MRCFAEGRPEASKTLVIEARVAAGATSKCECGALKKIDAGCCVNCALLDGSSRAEAGVISALRALGGGGSLYEIADCAGYEIRTVLRVLPDLVASGRIRKYETDGLTRGRTTEWWLDDPRAQKRRSECPSPTTSPDASTRSREGVS